MVYFWRLPAARACSLLLAIAATGDLVLLHMKSLSIAPDVVENVMTLLVPLSVVMGACFAANWRLKTDTARAARLISSISRFSINVAGAALAFTLLSVALGIFCFASNTLALPLQDGAFDATDRLFGFDWLRITAWVSEQPALAQALAWSYFSCMKQLGIVVVVLIATKRMPELWDFVTLIMFGLAVTLFFAALLPAASPVSYLRPDAALLSAMHGFGATYDYIDSFAAIRAGRQTVFSLESMKGIITFPSYHVVFALSVVYSLRHWAWLIWPCAILNLAVIVSAVPIGGHYVSDLAGGIAVFALSVASVETINGRLTILRSYRGRIWGVGGGLIGLPFPKEPCFAKSHVMRSPSLAGPNERRWSARPKR